MGRSSTPIDRTWVSPPFPGPIMDRRWLMLAAIVFGGCTQAPDAGVEIEQPRQISTDFGRLPAVLEGVRKPGEVALYEGLPSEFWEPRMLEQEVARKKTIRLHGY